MSEARSLWRKAQDAILGRIVSGEWGAGAMLPSEERIGAELGVSQGTARKALGELERAGVVERRQGRGTFVAVTTPERALFHFFRLKRSDGISPTPEVLRQTLRRRRASAAEAAALGDASVFEIDRVRSLDGRPAVRERIVAPVGLFPGLVDRGEPPNQLYAFYQRSWGVAVTRAEETLAAVAAGPADAEALGVAEGAPLLEVERRAFDIAGRLVELRTSRCLTVRHRYAVTLR